MNTVRDSGPRSDISTGVVVWPWNSRTPTMVQAHLGSSLFRSVMGIRWSQLSYPHLRPATVGTCLSPANCVQQNFIRVEGRPSAESTSEQGFAAAREEIAPATSQARPSVLVADDDRLIVATLSRGLRTSGFDVIETYDSAGALEGCLRYAPSVAVIDYKMPGSTGAELARAITSQTSVPIIFLSGYSETSIVRQAVEAGAMTYLVKPIDIAQLLPVIRSAIERAHDLRQLRSAIKRVQERDRTISIVIGLLMSRFQISAREAFDRLRRHARSTRSRIEDVAAALLRATETTASLYEKLNEQVQRHRSDKSPKR